MHDPSTAGVNGMDDDNVENDPITVDEEVHFVSTNKSSLRFVSRRRLFWLLLTTRLHRTNTLKAPVSHSTSLLNNNTMDNTPQD